jgi:diadenosine tetraphosphate (Ap4A) HIT family hydrolase
MATSLAFKPSADAVPGCDLCASAGGVLLWHDRDWRVNPVADHAQPPFYRVVCQRHVRLFSQRDTAQRQRCLELVARGSLGLRDRLAPTKINLAALGNMVPHLHWHVIARFDWDSHFPNPVWGAKLRDASPAASERLAIPLEQLDAAVVSALSAA